VSRDNAPLYWCGDISRTMRRRPKYQVSISPLQLSDEQSDMLACATASTNSPTVVLTGRFCAQQRPSPASKVFCSAAVQLNIHLLICRMSHPQVQGVQTCTRCHLASGGRAFRCRSSRPMAPSSRQANARPRRHGSAAAPRWSKFPGQLGVS
jgi:hypothetical protein